MTIMAQSPDEPIFSDSLDGSDSEALTGQGADGIAQPTSPTAGEALRRGTLVDRYWAADIAAYGGRRARQGFAYQAYVPKPIAEEEFEVAASVAEAAAETERASRALNEDPPVLGSLEALARQLLRAESVASSRIEGLITSHRRLAHVDFAEDDRDVTAQSVLANIHALERAVALATEAHAVSPNDIREIHRILFEGTRDEHIGGVIRDDQNWIGGRLPNPRDAEFIPPPPEEVERLIDDLCGFIAREDIPPVLQAAIAHVQFETIHPFADGNGRVGRALIHIVLRRRKVTPHYVPPVSLVLAGQADAYIRGLEAFRYDDENIWYDFFADATRRAANEAHSFAEKVAELQNEWRQRAGKPRSDSAAARLIDRLPAYPIIDAKSAEEITGASDEAVRLALQRLEKADVIRRVSLSRRRTAWESVGLFDLLDTFERDLGPEGRTPRPTKSQRRES